MTERGKRQASPAIGLDFGTSNCLVAAVLEGQPRTLALEDGESTLPSLVHLPRMLPPGASVDRDDPEAIREALQRQTVREAFALGALPRFGRAALRANLEDPDGFFFRSPKSFLAADIEAVHRDRFEWVVQMMLAWLRAQASEHLGSPVTRACIGRPVNFGGGSPADRERGNARALALLEAAAHRAGFEEVFFALEPVAAARDFERSLRTEALVLIVDVGGGTTDCSLAQLGPRRVRKRDRIDDILASCGDRIGGNDVDTSLNFACLMPCMGRGDLERSGLPVPTIPYADAADVYSVPAQHAFMRSGATLAAIRRRCDPQVAARVDRLERLRESAQTLWLTMKAEEAKLALAEAESAEVSLERIEADLRVQVSAEGMQRAMAPLLAGIERLVGETLRQAGAAPEIIYLTGGSARSPLVRRLLEQICPGVRLEAGDAYRSVASGLALIAQERFRPTVRA